MLWRTLRRRRGWRRRGASSFPRRVVWRCLTSRSFSRLSSESLFGFEIRWVLMMVRRIILEVADSTIAIMRTVAFVYAHFEM